MQQGAVPDLKHEPKSCLFLPGRLDGKGRHWDRHGAHIPSGVDPAGSPCHGQAAPYPVPPAQCRSKALPHTNIFIQQQDTLCPAGGRSSSRGSGLDAGNPLPLAFPFLFQFYFLHAEFLTRHKLELFPPPAISGSPWPAPREPQPPAEDAGSQRSHGPAAELRGGKSTTVGVKEENPPGFPAGTETSEELVLNGDLSPSPGKTSAPLSSKKSLFLITHCLKFTARQKVGVGLLVVFFFLVRNQIETRERGGRHGTTATKEVCPVYSCPSLRPRSHPAKPWAQPELHPRSGGSLQQLEVTRRVLKARVVPGNRRTQPKPTHTSGQQYLSWAPSTGCRLQLQ